MKLAFFIAAHRNPQQVEDLAHLLSDPRDSVVLHIDRKADAAVHDTARRLRDRLSARLLPSRTIYWGGWSMSRILLDAIRDLCASGLDWDYLINLSGQDMPLRPIDELRTFLAARPGANYIDCRQISELDNPLRGVIQRRVRWITYEGAGRTRRLPVPMTLLHRGRVRYYGSQWVMLSRPFCDWVARTGARDAGWSTLPVTFASDELLSQQMIMASPFRHTLVKDNKRYYRFAGRAHPVVLQRDDLPTVDASGAFFARKFDPAVDASIIRELAARIAP
ncbi:beta-1,6-N-acetylglucosaminyltransferase [Emcibacter sp. SYSU 3D8]|uniref:beta-1,6-N-acetylglucosaminyltransferase n=1 Tax=Emcibacter sp. SYSU 3D8 TaxID=3133969 RepID=UPI0031FE9957